MDRSISQSIGEKIQSLKNELEERKKALPRHTICPHQLIAIEELEEQISALERQLVSEEDGE